MPAECRFPVLCPGDDGAVILGIVTPQCSLLAGPDTAGCLQPAPDACFIQILTPSDGCGHPFLLKAHGFISGQKVEIQTPNLGAFC